MPKRLIIGAKKFSLKI